MSQEDIDAIVAMMGVTMALAILGFFVLIAIAFKVGVAWFLSDTLARIPAEHRKQEPGLAWLLLIPCVDVVWKFFVWPKVAESFQSYFVSKGRTEFGDCGAQLATIYCGIGVVTLILGCVGQIPIVGLVALINLPLAILALVLFVLLIAKFLQLRKELTTG